ncbi:PIRIN-RELATED [Salix purpurea]|uniref:PIRIN-RELATED n=1 Tax=Salix purpurea TaxID=77065 RepID=A0A9Q0SRY1_SALPP|nr:PIRIN-RELATED [Salix purpurea]
MSAGEYMRASVYRNFVFRLHPAATAKARKITSRTRNIMSESDQSIGFSAPRLVAKKVLAKLQHEGQGAVVRRSIGRSELKFLDPFLMLDEFSGFETVTYMLQGGITHQDFAGHKGTIHTGDVQWMTAGRGIIHSEMPAGEGYNLQGQDWNLPPGVLTLNSSAQSNSPMIEPAYQELLSHDIRTAEKDGVEVRIIAGKSMGVQSPVYTRTPTMYLDFTMKPRTQMHQSIPESWNGFVYIIEGEGVFGKQSSSPVTAHHVLVLGPGDGLSVWNRASTPLRFVLIAGQPINEPVVQYGPFVMNTQAEIDRTLEDYHYSKNGFEMAKYWRSQ